MSATEISLTEVERYALDEISQRTGKSHNELIREAVDRLIVGFQRQDRRALMQKAKGIWKDRDDLSDLTELRREWQRF